MLFRPSFCCNCGERIERAEWSIRDSRRFCDLCSTDFTIQEILPKVVIGLAAAVLAVGAVNYFAGGQRPRELVLTRAAQRTTAEARNAEPPAQAPPAADNTAKTTAPAAVPADGNSSTPRAVAALSPQAPAERPAVAVSAPIYYCGAETKKGTPCSRKVKGNVRCWQHTGMPAMLPPDKLLVSR